MKRRFRASPIFMTLVLIFLYLPMLIVILYSFNANTSRYTFAFTGFSLKNYRDLWKDTKGLLAALRFSLILGGISCGISLVIGVLGALGMSMKKFKVQGLLENTSLLPIMIPEIILGMAFLAVFTAVGFRFGMLTLVLGHVTFCTPYIYVIVKGRLSGMDAELTEAARDLGASPMRAFWDITLPLILPAVASGTLLAFAMSMDDFVISYFVNGATSTTLPLKVYSSVKTGVSLQVNALSTLMVGTIAIGMAIFGAGKAVLRRARKKI